MLEQLLNNQFVSGGVVLGVLAAVAHQCKAVPGRVWTWFKCLFVIEVDIQSKDEAFWWLNRWLAKHPYGAKRSRLLTVKTERTEKDGNQPEIIFSPAVGQHWFWHRGRLVILTRERRDTVDPSSVIADKESFTVRMFTRDRDRVKSMLEEARELVHPAGEKRVTIYTSRYGVWSPAIKRHPRSVDSVILKHGMLEDITSRVRDFFDTESLYAQRGVPWRLGILLEGPPGGGKSSTVVAIASHFGLDIAVINLSGGVADDSDLQRLLIELPKNTIILLEDIDCVFEQREQSDDAVRVTFSGLLNAIDGVTAAEGRVLFMSTNHVEKLDPALIRPGRADYHYTIGPPDSSQVVRMFSRFYPEATDSQNLRFAEIVPRVSMAVLQSHMLKHKDPEQAIRHASEL